jgi:predicted CXXCH cytochrome family protein
MKKILWLMALAMILALGTASFASANGGPHGGYTATTDACAGCHRAHTASGANLLIDTDTYTLCMTCHGSAGTGADTNVDDGLYTAVRSTTTVGAGNTADGGNLLGGGFTNYESVAITSAHEMTGAGNTNVAWGNSVARGVGAAITDTTFTCASCHDPHGSTNYRILSTTINGVAVTVTQVDEGAQDYDDEDWPADMSAVCVACHDSYHDNSLTKDGTSYTHNVDMAFDAGINSGVANPESAGYGGYYLPLADTGTSNLVTCNTCHLSHGSSAVMSGHADGGPDGTGSVPGDTTATDSALLRLDNRGVCEVCHQK